MDDAPTKAAALLPLTEATFFILIALSKPRHGYAVLQAVEGMSGGRVTLGPGTLYGALQRMLKQGLVERMESVAVVDDRRKEYRLTDFGRLVVEQEVARLKEMVVYGEEALR